MKIIRPNCREHLTANDVEFIVSVLSHSAREAGFLARLLTEEELRDRILDDEHLVAAIQDRVDHLTISSQLYFYLLVRHEFHRQGLEDRNLADYVAELLSEFSELRKMSCPGRLPDASDECVVDMLRAMQDRGEEDRFGVCAHIGNYTLFMTGLYPERIAARRDRRGAPGLGYYESMGSRNYGLASRSPVAGRYGVAAVFDELSESFHEVRLALNSMNQRTLFTGRHAA